MKNNFDIADFIGILFLLIISLCICFSISFYEVNAELVTNRVQWLNGFNYSANFSNGNILHSQVSQNVTLTANYNYVVRIPVSYSFYAEDNSQIGTDHPVSTQFSLRSNYSYGVNETFCQLKDGYIECPISSSFKSIVYLWGYTPPDVTTTFIFNDAYEVVIVESTYYLNLLLSINSTLTEINKSLRDKVGDIDQSIKDQTDQQHKDSQATQDKIQSVDDTLNDGSVDSDQINSIGSNLPGTNGVLSSVLAMPVSFFSSLLNNLSTTSCPVINFTIPIVDMPCSIPCFRSFLSDIGVLTWFEGFGGLIGGLLLFYYIIHLGKSFNKMSDLDDTNNESWGGL